MVAVAGWPFGVIFFTSPIWGILLILIHAAWKNYQSSQPLYPDHEQAKRDIDRMFDDLEQTLRRYEKW